MVNVGSFYLQPHWEKVGKPPEVALSKALMNVIVLPSVVIVLVVRFDLWIWGYTNFQDRAVC